MPYPASTATALTRRPGLPVPDSLRRNIRFIRGESADDWLELSVGLAADLAAAWSVVPEVILEGGAMSVVVQCRDAAGDLAVLKVPGNRDMGLAESSALAAWDNGTMPRLLASDPETGAFLMEHIRTGGPAPSPSEITRLLAGLHLPAADNLHPLDRLLHDRAKGAAKRFTGLNLESAQADLAAATGLMARLQATAFQTRVHGDFQAKNVLNGLAGPIAIDPLPAAGDPLSDLGLWIGGGSGGPRTAALLTFTCICAAPRRLLPWAWALAVVEYRPGSLGAEDAADFIDRHRSEASAYLS